MDEINRRRGYTVHVTDEICAELRIAGVSAVRADSGEAVRRLVDADLVTTAVGLGVLPRVAPVIAAGLRARKAAGVAAPLNVVACENGVRATSRLKASVYEALERELLLLKVESDVHNRTELREIACIYKAKIIDLSPDSMVLELTGRPEKVDAFLKILADYKILEQCRTGVTALERGGMHQHMQKPPQEVRAAQLPLPGTRCPQ